MSIACMQINLNLYDIEVEYVNLQMYFKIICFTPTSGVTLYVLFFSFRDWGACLSLCLCVLVGRDLPAQTKTVNEFWVAFSLISKISMVDQDRGCYES